MADVHTPQQRRFNMQQIRSTNTNLKCWYAAGYRYRLHDKKLPGKAGIVLPRYRTLIFVHGCCWHGHTGCRYYVVLKTKTDWWLHKINTNKANDTKSVKPKMTGRSLPYGNAISNRQSCKTP